MTTDIKTALAEARALLQAKNIEHPRLEAEILLAHVLNCSRASLYARADLILDPVQVQGYQSCLDRRIEGIPTAYILGKKEFMGLDFKVSPAVLIPRPDTELMVERAIHLAKQVQRPVMADVGTGSGAIAISTAHFVPQLEVLAVDISPEALELAQENAVTHRVKRRVKFLQSNLLEQLIKTRPPKSLDLITANLPYIPSGDMAGLAKEVQREPKLALDGGPDGLDLYRQLIPQARQLLKAGGHLLIEIGPGQGDGALALFEQPHWQAKLYRDLGDRERLVVAGLTGPARPPGPRNR
ncbi:peptide chain release factor N(5)-glutamine methyltransferase [Desulfofalx alkaliphila]|uniref:peptide chain release factor N(5)-glutamine methyltransferase n=1 Tax=Desulfofalx alkaliphila TaxID=105483 RepID=UPI000689E6A3|nr:peptide chain release factor N(5)-glutamine methyltransferase [Desulfofalx alkaliphila]